MSLVDPIAKKAYQREYYAKNKDRILEMSRAYQKDNYHAIKEKQKAWNQKNLNRVNECARARYQKNREKKLAQNKEWMKKNRKKMLEHYARWKKTSPAHQATIARNREEVNRKHREKYHQFKEFYAEYYRNFHHTSPRRVAIFVKWEVCGKLCYICGEHLPFEDIHADHVIPRTANGTNDIINLMPTHSVCNRRKSDHVGFAFVRGDLIETCSKIECFPRNLERNKRKDIHVD